MRPLILPVLVKFVYAKWVMPGSTKQKLPHIHDKLNAKTNSFLCLESFRCPCFFVCMLFSAAAADVIAGVGIPAIDMHRRQSWLALAHASEFLRRDRSLVEEALDRGAWQARDGTGLSAF